MYAELTQNTRGVHQHKRIRQFAGVRDAWSLQAQRRNLRKLAHGKLRGLTSGRSNNLLDFRPQGCTRKLSVFLFCLVVYILNPKTPRQHLNTSSSKKVLQKIGESSVCSRSASTTVAVAHAHNLRLHGREGARLRPLPAPTRGRPRTRRHAGGGRCACLLQQRIGRSPGV